MKTFLESDLSPREYVEQKLKETATAEFHLVDPNNLHSLEVYFNGRKKPMSFEEFLKLAKSDNEAFKVLEAVKLKMQKMNYKGSMLEFIARFWGIYNDYNDVFVPNGLPLSSDQPSKIRYDMSGF